MAAEQIPDDVGTARVALAEGIDVEVADWEKATAGVLRKMKRLGDDGSDHDVWEILTRRTLDGISVTPLGTPTSTADLADPGLPGQAPFTRGATAGRELEGWDIRAWFTDADADVTADHVVTDLENGVSSLWLTVGDGAIDAADLARILEPVILDLAPIVLDAPDDPVGAARVLSEVLADRSVDVHPDTSLGADPIGAWIRGGDVADPSVVIEVARLAADLGARGVVVDATAIHDQGASEVQELAYSLLAGITYLRALVDAGFTSDEAAGQIDVRYAATDEQFVTIAKLRAGRRLWNRMLELSGVSAEARGQRQHAVTSRPMMSAYDPYVNMLRTTVAAFAAGVGGAQAVTVLPFDESLGLPEAFSRRIARNQSSLLIHESHVGKVADPAGGAHAVESLTDDLARAAWTLFGELDDHDGLDAALGVLRPQVEATADRREREIAVRTRPITGLSEFPNLGEQRPERRPYGRVPVVRRYGASFEQMRDRPADSAVFLATLGSMAQHTARATFVTNLLASGGIDTVTAGATDGVDDVLAAYRDADSPPVACLAGPDALYAEWGDALVSALREAGARHVVVAGKNDLDADDSAIAGGDVIDLLRRTREELSA